MIWSSQKLRDVAKKPMHYLKIVLVLKLIIPFEIIRRDKNAIHLDVAWNMEKNKFNAPLMNTNYSKVNLYNFNTCNLLIPKQVVVSTRQWMTESKILQGKKMHIIEILGHLLEIVACGYPCMYMCLPFVEGEINK